MINLETLRNNPEHVAQAIAKKDASFDIQKLLSLDTQVRTVRLSVEDLRAKKNTLAKQARGGITDELRAQSIEVSKQLKEQEQTLATIEEAFSALLLACPNIPEDSVPVGGPENNVVVKEHGQQPSFDFAVQHHLDLGTNNNWFDFEIGAKLGGSNLAFYKSEGAKLLYALSMFMLKNNESHGYEIMLPSVFVQEESLRVAGNFPKFKDQVFQVPEDDLFLVPTAEVALTNMYRDQIIMRKDLPIRATALTSCFRREGGAYGAHERGLIRMRQFEKVELYTICAPEHSNDELGRMIAVAEDILKKLDLHYRVSLLAAGDCSFQSAKTFDIEVWLPGQKEYREVSSASNCTDFQARRGMIRYKDRLEDKAELVHTLNASSLALPRLMVAIMETYQQADGTIVIPDALRGYGLY